MLMWEFYPEHAALDRDPSRAALTSLTAAGRPAGIARKWALLQQRPLEGAIPALSLAE